MIDNDVLVRSGLYLDEMTRKLRLLHPDLHQLSHDLITECDEYRQSAYNFQKHVALIIDGIDRMGYAADKARMDTFGKRSRVVAVFCQCETTQQHLRQEIEEKRVLFHRRRCLHEAMVKTDAQQKDIINRLFRK